MTQHLSNLSFFTHYLYIFIEWTHPVLVHKYITLCFGSVISHLLSMTKIICSWLESRHRQKLVCVWHNNHWNDFQLSFLNPEGAHEKPGDGLCPVCASYCLVVLQDLLRHHQSNRLLWTRQNASMCTCPSCKVCVCSASWSSCWLL